MQDIYSQREREKLMECGQKLESGRERQCVFVCVCVLCVENLSAYFTEQTSGAFWYKRQKMNKYHNSWPAHQLLLFSCLCVTNALLHLESFPAACFPAEFEVCDVANGLRCCLTHIHPHYFVSFRFNRHTCPQNGPSSSSTGLIVLKTITSLTK